MVTVIASSSFTPGRRRFSRVSTRAAARAGSRAQSVTRFPARAAWIARAVPQAPAPITATLPIDQPDHFGSLAMLTHTQAVNQCPKDPHCIGLKSVGRVDHEQATPVESRGSGGSRRHTSAATISGMPPLCIRRESRGPVAVLDRIPRREDSGPKSPPAGREAPDEPVNSSGTSYGGSIRIRPRRGCGGSSAPGPPTHRDDAPRQCCRARSDGARCCVYPPGAVRNREGGR